LLALPSHLLAHRLLPLRSVAPFAKQWAQQQRLCCVSWSRPEKVRLFPCLAPGQSLGDVPAQGLVGDEATVTCDEVWTEYQEMTWGEVRDVASQLVFTAGPPADPHAGSSSQGRREEQRARSAASGGSSCTATCPADGEWSVEAETCVPPEGERGEPDLGAQEAGSPKLEAPGSGPDSKGGLSGTDSKESAKGGSILGVLEQVVSQAGSLLGAHRKDPGAVSEGPKAGSILDVLRRVAPRMMARADANWGYGLAEDLDHPKYQHPKHWSNPLETK
jgi:hypothetical protein